jgi:hypothetical protein
MLWPAADLRRCPEPRRAWRQCQFNFYRQEVVVKQLSFLHELVPNRRCDQSKQSHEFRIDPAGLPGGGTRNGVAAQFGQGQHQRLD